MTIAIVLDGHLALMRADADWFFAAHHQHSCAPGQLTQSFGPGFVASRDRNYADVPEEPLDVETAHIIAPAARIIYVAANCSTGRTTLTQTEEYFLDAQAPIVDRHLGDVETNSYSTTESSCVPPWPQRGPRWPSRARPRGSGSTSTPVTAATTSAAATGRP